MDKFLAGRLSLPVNLQFFKGGSTQTVRKRDPKSGEHLAMDQAVFNLLSPIATRYGGQNVFGSYSPQAASGSIAGNGKGGSAGQMNTAVMPSGQMYGEESSAGPTFVFAGPGARNENYGVASNGNGGATSQGQGTTSPLMQNYDIADQQFNMVNQNTNQLLGSVNNFLGQSNNAYGNAESIANNYVNPYGAKDFNNINKGLLADSSKLIGAGTNAIGKSESLADNYVNPYSSSQFDQANQNMMGDIAGYLGNSDKALSDSYDLVGAHQTPYGNADFDNYVSKMGQNVDQSTKYATKYYDDADWYLGQNKELASKGGNAALDNLMSKVYESLNEGYRTSASDMLANAAGRGVVNSSTSTRALSDLSDSVSRSAAQQYMSGFNTLLGNALQGAQTADNLAQNVVSTAGNTTNNYKNVIDSMLGVNQGSLSELQGKAGVLQNVASGYGQNAGIAQNAYNKSIDSMFQTNQDARDTMQGRAGILQDAASGYNQTAGTSQNAYNSVLQNMLGANKDALGTMQSRVGALNDVASGYNQNYNSGLAGLESMAKLPTQYYQNALAPISPLYNYWKDLTDSYYGHEDFDTVVNQGK